MNRKDEQAQGSELSAALDREPTTNFVHMEEP
jgi:hypothetical protein